MPEFEEATSHPITASPLNATWLRITGKDKWLPATATVYSREYTDLNPGAQADLPGLIETNVEDEVGNYRVTYSYAVAGEYYNGVFNDFGSADEVYVNRGDTLTIRYNPRNPAKSYYPGARTQTRFNLISLAIGAVFGLAALVLLVAHKSH